ncbi:nestin-like [Salvelinus alpinus]|uniref:nestin-like n=1 Tax=Salvelinus alpinus TaxID=8036 RepID=UPI0039FDA7F6
MELHRLRHHHSHRTDDKLQMLNLNQRLETYLGRVRLLEEENKLLCQEIQALRGSGQGGRMGLEDKLSLARQEVEEAWRKKDQVELELGSLGEELQVLGLQRQWEADAHGEVKKKLADSRKQMEEERRAQIWLREKVSQLEKQIQFQIQTHQEDVAGFQATLTHVRPALPPPPPQTGTQLPSLQELGEEYSQMAVRAWHEAAMVFQGQVDSLDESLNQARTRLAQVGQEKIESQLKLQALENELQSAQDRRQCLERSVAKQRDRQRQEIQNLQAHLDVLEMEKGALGNQIDTLLTESRGLLQLKMSLGMEVATYRALLDNESLKGDFSSTNQLRSTYISDGVPSSRGVKQSFQTQLATSHMIRPISTIHRASPQSNVTMMSASPIWTQNRVTLNKTPESCRKTEEEHIDFGVGSNHQVSCSTPYPKVPQDGISVDHFRPQDIHKEVNYAEPLSPPTEEAGADVISLLGSDYKEQYMWDMEKEKEDQNIVRTWFAEEKPVLESAMSHQVETCFSMPTVFSTDAQELYSPSVSYERAGSVTGAHSAFSANYDNDVPFETSFEKEEPLLDMPYGPMNASEERDLETAKKDAEWAGNEGLESETKSVLEQAFEYGAGKSYNKPIEFNQEDSMSYESTQASHGYNKPIEFNQEDNMSYESTQAFNGLEEAFCHVKRLEEDVINLPNEDENDMSNKHEEQLEDEWHAYGYGKDDCERSGGFNKENDMTERIDKFNQEEIISYESAQASHWSEEVFHHVERVEEGDIHFTKGDDENDMSNRREEQHALNPNGDVKDEWDRVGGYNEENRIGERMDDWKEGKDHVKEEETWNNRETQPNRSDQEYIPSNVEKLNQFEQEQIPSGREKLNISDNDKEDHDEANYCQNNSVLWRAELEGDSYAQDNTLADTHPLIRYKSDETDVNTQASHMGESDSSDGEEDREVCQTGTDTCGEGKSKQFDTMEYLYEESEGDVIDQESNMGSTHQEDMDASQTKEHATQENDEENAVDQLIQEAEEEQSYEELTEPGEYSMVCSDEDYNEERIDRLVEQELENLSISSYSEHFNGQMIESESVLSLQIESHTELAQTQDILYSEEVEQIHSERLNQSEQEHIPSGGEKLNQTDSEHIPSNREKLNVYVQEHIPSDGEKLNQSEQENIPSGGEKLNQSEPEYIISGGEKLDICEQEHIPSDREIYQFEPEHITSNGEKLNQSEQENIPLGGEKLNQTDSEHIPSNREKLNVYVQEHIPSDGEKLNQSEQENIPSGGEKLNQSEQENIPSGGEKLNQSEQENIPSGGEKLNQSEAEDITSGGETLDICEQEHIPSDREKMYQFEPEHIPSNGEKLNQSEQENIPLGGERINQSEQEYIISSEEKLNQSEQENVPSGEEKRNQSEQENVPSSEEKLNQSEPEYIISGGEKLDICEQEHIPSDREKMYQFEPEHITSNGEKLNQSEQENIPLGGEKINQSEQQYIISGGEKLNVNAQEHIPTDGEKMNQSKSEYIPSGGEKLNQSEQENIPSGGEKLNQSEQENIPSGGEKLNQSEQENIPSGREKLNQSEQENIPSGGEKLNQSEQENIPSGGEKLNQSEQENIPSGREKLNQSEQENIPSGGEKLNQSEQENIPSGGEKLNQSEQENIPSGGEKLNQSEQENIPSGGEKLNQSEQENIPSGGEKLNQSEQENIPSGGEKLNQSEQENIPSGGEKLNQSEQENIPSGGETLDICEQEHIPSDREKMNPSEPEYTPSGGEKLNQYEQQNIPLGSEKLNQYEPEYITSGEYKLNLYEQEHIPSDREKMNQSDPKYIPSGGEKLNQSEQEHIPSGGEKLNQSEQEHIPSGGEKLNQSEQECISSEVMYSVHSRILMTSEHTSLRESSGEISKEEYLAQGKVFSGGLGTEAVPDKIEGQDDQNLSMLTHADFTESHSIYSSLNSRPESQTNMNNLDIEESNSTDDESPNASQYLQPVTKANLTADQEDLLDVAVSHYEDCNPLIEHSAEEVTSYQASNECLQTDEWEVLESPNKHLESGDPFAGHKRDSERSSKTDSEGRDLHSFLSSGVHNNFWGSNLETGAPYQLDEPYDHVTELPNQNLALANNLTWVDLENPQGTNWNTKMDSDTPKASTLEEEDKQMPSQVKQLVCRDVVEGVNVTSEGSEDEGDSWSSGEE